MSFKSIPENTKIALDVLDGTYSNILNEYGFYLAGGTSLALQINHRISYDLDFFSEKDFEPDMLLNYFNKESLENIQTSKGTLQFNFQNCSISFFHYPYKVLENFYTLGEYKIRLAQLLDIGLMKVTAIADRGLKKDFIDLYFIAKQAGGLQPIMDKFVLKYPDANYYHYLKSLSYFEEAEISPDLNMLEGIEWSKVKEFFLIEAKILISNSN